jgi:calcineurin-like phosphoesterase family protein
MNEVLIRNWNEVVKPEDTTYHLGDVAFCGIAKLAAILEQLNGYKILIKGNHDHRRAKMIRAGFNEAINPRYDPIEYRGWRLTHQPFYDSLDIPTLCGHVHQRWTRVENTVNVGVDVWNWRPITFEEAINAKHTENPTVDGH